MKVNVLILCAAFAYPATALADPAIGETVALYPASTKDIHYTGVLVKANVLAPCNARSHHEDITFDLKHGDRIVKWLKPCPSIPRFIEKASVDLFLSDDKMSLSSAAQMMTNTLPQK